MHNFFWEYVLFVTFDITYQVLSKSKKIDVIWRNTLSFSSFWYAYNFWYYVLQFMRAKKPVSVLVIRGTFPLIRLLTNKMLKFFSHSFSPVNLSRINKSNWNSICSFVKLFIIINFIPFDKKYQNYKYRYTQTSLSVTYDFKCIQWFITISLFWFNAIESWTFISKRNTKFKRYKT